MERAIDYRVSLTNTQKDISFLYYPYTPFDLAVLQDGERIKVKPIIEVLLGHGFFNFKGNSYYLRDFSKDDNTTDPPDWALTWLYDRIHNKPFNIDLRMSHMDHFMLEGTIKRRQSEAVINLGKFDEHGSVDF